MDGAGWVKVECSCRAVAGCEWSSSHRWCCVGGQTERGMWLHRIRFCAMLSTVVKGERLVWHESRSGAQFMEEAPWKELITPLECMQLTPTYDD